MSQAPSIISTPPAHTDLDEGDGDLASELETRSCTVPASAHHQRGLVSYYAAQEARRPAIAQQLLLLDIQAQRLSTDITLIKALGGDYRGPALSENAPSR